MVAAATQIIRLPLQYCADATEIRVTCSGNLVCLTICLHKQLFLGIGATQKEQRYDDVQ
ncbi:unnamed protein product [Brassica oleracea var. botrytis]